MQNSEVKFGSQRGEVTGPRKQHDEGFQKLQAPTQDFLLVGCGAGRVAVCNFFGEFKKELL
jgi:hypothetical protein